METPLRARQTRTHSSNAETIRQRNGIYGHGKTLEQLIDITAQHWAKVETLLQTQNMLRYDMNCALDELMGWLTECYQELYYSEFMWHVRLDAAGKIFIGNPRNGHTPQLMHEVARLYNLTARIVHQLQQEWTGSPTPGLPGSQEPLDPVQWHETIGNDNYRLAQYAELVAGQARGSLGPIDDARYHHPDRRTWTDIHLRTKRRIANIARRWAEDDARKLQVYDRQAKAK